MNAGRNMPFINYMDLRVQNMSSVIPTKGVLLDDYFVVRTILNVCDDKATGDWIRIVMQGSGIKCRVRSATSGNEAFRLLLQHHYDLCVTEYALEDITGVQLCERIRQNGFDLPVLFFSAMDRPIDRSRAFAAGASEYLAKPDDIAEFPDTARRLLKVRRYHSPLVVPRVRVGLAA
jgi:CheY-like chemotaxis protein